MTAAAAPQVPFRFCVFSSFRESFGGPSGSIESITVSLLALSLFPCLYNSVSLPVFLYIFVSLFL